MSAPLGTVDACTRAGLSFRQVDYWVRNGAITPSVAEAAGSGSRRLWNAHDVRMLTAIGRVTTDLTTLDIDMPVELVDRLWRGLTARADLVITHGSVTIAVGLATDPRPCDHPRTHRVYHPDHPDRCTRCGAEFPTERKDHA